MNFEEYKLKSVRHIVLPSTEGCASGPLEFDLIMPPAAVVNPLAMVFYKKINAHRDVESAEASDNIIAAGTLLNVEILKASTWPEGFSLEDVNNMSDLLYLLGVAGDFFRSGNETQMTAGVSPAVSPKTSEPSSEPDSNEAETCQATA